MEGKISGHKPHSIPGKVSAQLVELNHEVVWGEFDLQITWGVCRRCGLSVMWEHRGPSSEVQGELLQACCRPPRKR